MRANYKPKRIKTYAERANALRSLGQTELLQYGMMIGSRLMALAVNRQQHIANDRLIRCFAEYQKLFLTEMLGDPEMAAEGLFSELDRIMGNGWEEKQKVCADI